MAKIIDLPTMNDSRGSLTVIEKVIGFDIKRVYYIYNTDKEKRGGHRHKKTQQLLVSVHGSCDVFCENSTGKNEIFALDIPSKGLLVDCDDWHIMENFSADCVLLVLASEYYDADDYISERY